MKSNLKPLILCVDDEKIVLNALIQELKASLAGTYDFEAAETTDEVWDLLEHETQHRRVAFVISDWLMPGMRGDEFLTHIHRKYPEIRTILLTGMTTPEALRNAMVNANLYAWFRKPWDPVLLVKRISEVPLD
jgi:response regulator RpfG family c-di-GMP phosphodiesterase